MPSLLQRFAWLPLRLFMLLFCSVKITGLDNVRSTEGNVIIASNHTSELDPLFIVAALPFFSSKLPLIFVSREKSFYKNSNLGFIYGGKFFEAMGAYPAFVGMNDYNKALPHHIDALRAGKTVCIFPMGKRHDISDIDNARGGVSFLSTLSDHPIIPVKIEGLYKRTTRELLTRKAKLTITFGKPVYAKSLVPSGALLTANRGREQHEAAAKILMRLIRDL